MLSTDTDNRIELSYSFKEFSEDNPVFDLSDAVGSFDVPINQRDVIKYSTDFIKSLEATDAKPSPDIARKISFLFSYNPRSNCLSTHETRVKEIRAEINKVTSENLGKTFKHIKRLINTRKLLQIAVDYIIENAVSSKVLMGPLLRLCEMLAADPASSSYPDPIGVVNSELLHNLQKRFLDREWLADSSSTDIDAVDRFKKRKERYINNVSIIAKMYTLRKDNPDTKLYMPKKSILGCLSALSKEDGNYNENFECVYCILKAAGKHLDTYSNAYMIDPLFDWFKGFSERGDERMADHNRIQFIPELCELRKGKWVQAPKRVDTVLLQTQKGRDYRRHK